MIDHSVPDGGMAYLQLPATDAAASAAFYEAVLGWRVDRERNTFAGPGLIGHWSADRAPAADGTGPLLWLRVDQLYQTLHQVEANGGRVHDRPRADSGRRWLVEVDDPAGNRIGLTAPARTARAQTMIAVRDVEASSRWYQELLGLRSDHGGPEYERLVADGVLVLQLHRRDVEHHHGAFVDETQPVGNGVLLWFGEVTDFDGVVRRAAQLGVPVVREPHRNPPGGGGNGPAHREVWLQDPDGYTLVVASPDGEAHEL